MPKPPTGRVLGIAVAAGLVAAAARLWRAEVVGDSMTPSLAAGDRLLVVRGLPVRVGDVVAADDPRHPTRTVIKRVVATTGAGLVLEGDNPRASTDSRVFGEVDATTVQGRAVYRYAPPERRGFVGRRPASGPTPGLVP